MVVFYVQRDGDSWGHEGEAQGHQMEGKITCLVRFLLHTGEQ
jgi:hypothetical protein